MWQWRSDIVIQPRRWLLWLVVCYVAGALTYFSLLSEPSHMNFIPALPLFAGIWFALRRMASRGWLLLLPLGCFVAGAWWAKIHTDQHPVTMLHEELRISTVRGLITDISDVPGGYRITLDEVQIEGLKLGQTPARIRIKLRGAAQTLMTGQRISVRAGLLPPSGPVMPGAFDFARYFYFEQIGAVGYAIPPATIEAESPEDVGFSLWLTHRRTALSARIRSQMSMPEATIAAALMVGDRGAIPPEVNDVMRDTNLSHILSISGLHMALLTGLIYLLVRMVLVLIPFTRHWRSIKRVAAMVALLTGFVYLLVAGLPPSAIRAYIMVALVFLAILLNREVMPMRSLAIAALAMLLYNPSYVIQPGFQLSFIATAALIAWYETVRKTADRQSLESRFRRIGIYIAGIMMTSLAAELSTLPLVLYHFNSLSLYGLLANLLVSPIVSFCIMPAIILSFVMMPFGIEVYGLMVVEWGIHWMIEVARMVASIPYAQFFATAPTPFGMVCAMLGVAWVVICRGRIRFAGAVLVAAGLATALTVTHPDMLISHDGKQIAARIDGELVMVKGRAQGFIPSQWANATGHAALPYVGKNHPDWRCDTVGCALRIGKEVIAFPSQFEAFAQDCQQADMVVTRFYLSKHDCAQPSLIIDRRRLQEFGSHWLWVDEMRLGSTAQLHGNRPWSR